MDELTEAVFASIELCQGVLCVQEGRGTASWSTMHRIQVGAPSQIRAPWDEIAITRCGD